MRRSRGYWKVARVEKTQVLIKKLFVLIQERQLEGLSNNLTCITKLSS